MFKYTSLSRTRFPKIDFRGRWSRSRVHNGNGDVCMLRRELMCRIGQYFVEPCIFKSIHSFLCRAGITANVMMGDNIPHTSKHMSFRELIYSKQNDSNL